jgi:hypothetical protein
VSVRGAARADGTIMGMADLPKPARVTVALSGDLRRPHLTFAGAAPGVVVRGVEAQAPRVVGALRDGRLRLRASGGIAGGTLVGQGSARLDGSLAFSASVAVRGVAIEDAARMAGPWIRRKGSTATDAYRADALDGVTGRASADIRLEGDRRDWHQRGYAIVQALAPRVRRFAVDDAELIARIEGGAATIQRATARRGPALAVASGQLDLRTLRADLSVQADAVSLRDLSEWSGLDAETGPTGTVYLRDGAVSGALSRPSVSGTLYGHGLEAGGVRLGYAVAAFEGTPDALMLDGELVSVPAAAAISATVRRPFSGAPWLSGTAHVSDLDLEDATSLAGAHTPVEGLAWADIVVNTPITTLEIEGFRVRAAQMTVADIAVANASVEGALERGADGFTAIVHDLSASVGGGTVVGRGVIGSDGTFSLDAAVDQVPLSALSDVTGSYATLSGRVEGALTLSGRSAPEHGSGPVLAGFGRVGTKSMLVNGQDVGDLRGRFEVRDRAIIGLAGRGAAVALETQDSVLCVKDFTYNLDQKDFQGTVAASDIGVEPLRRALERSPAFMVGEAGVPVRRSAAALAPLGGRLSALGEVSAGPDTWSISARLDGARLRVGDLSPDALTARVEADDRRLVVRDLELASGDAFVSAAGDLEYGRSVTGTIAVQGLDLETLAKWLPADSPVRGVGGVLDTLNADISGSPEAPNITMSAAARQVRYRPGLAGEAMAGLSAPAVRLTGATVRDGLLGFEDLAVTLAGTDAGPDAQPVPPVELHASGRVPFTWARPYVAEDAMVEVDLRLPDSELGALQAIAPRGSSDLIGSYGAEFKVRGTRAQLERLAAGDVPEGRNLDITGSGWLKADTIGAPRVRTILGDVDLKLTLEAGRVRVSRSDGGETVARVFARSPGGEQRTETGVVQASGSLPLWSAIAGDAGLRLSIPRLQFDEAPFPGFATGRLAGTVGARSGQTAGDGATLVVTGSVAEPRIAGQIVVTEAAIRLPVTDRAPVARRPTPAIDPTLDIRLAIPDGASVRSSLVTASLATSSDSPVRLTGRLSDPRLAGTLNIRSGSLLFPTARLAVRPGGTVSLRYPGAGAVGADDAALDVSVDLAAQGRITARSVTGATRRYLVTVDARGPLLDRPSDPIGSASGRLRLTYRSDPPDLALSSEGMARRVQALLGGQDALQAVFSRQGDAGQVLVGKVVDYLGGALVPDLVDQMGVGRALGLRELTVDYSRTGAFVLRLSRDLVGPFEVGYWRQLSGIRDRMTETGDWEFRLGVRLRRGFRLTWTVDDQRTNAYRLEGVYSF